MKSLKLSLAVIAALGLVACKSSTEEQVQQLQQTQEQMNTKASQNLDHAKILDDNADKFTKMADQLQSQADAMNKEVQELAQAYAQFDDADSDDAVAIRERKVTATQKAIDLQEQVNKYKNQAADATSQANDLKATANTEANEAQELAEKIKTLQSTEN